MHLPWRSHKIWHCSWVNKRMNKILEMCLVISDSQWRSYEVEWKCYGKQKNVRLSYFVVWKHNFKFSGHDRIFILMKILLAIFRENWTLQIVWTNTNRFSVHCPINCAKIIYFYANESTQHTNTNEDQMENSFGFKCIPYTELPANG